MKSRDGIINNLKLESNISDLRFKKKSELVTALKILSSLNTDYGISGHITVKDPELEGHFWVNPFGVKFNDVTIDDLLLVNTEGEVIEGSGFPNSAAIFIHGPFHWKASNVECIVHSHTFYSMAMGLVEQLVEPTTIESCEFFENQAIYRNYTGVATTEDVGLGILDFYLEHKKDIILLKNHGILIVGNSIKQAIWRLLSFEKCCKFHLFLKSLNMPYSLLDDEIIAKTKMELSTLKANEFQIKPTWKQYE